MGESAVEINQIGAEAETARRAAIAAIMLPPPLSAAIIGALAAAVAVTVQTGAVAEEMVHNGAHRANEVPTTGATLSKVNTSVSPPDSTLK